MQYLKIKNVPKFKKWLTSCELDTKTESIIGDLGKKRKSNMFSEASRRTIKELGNIELSDLEEISQTVECPACLKYAPEELFCCTCGVCLMLSPEQKRKI